MSAPVTAKWAKGSGGPSGDECQNLIIQPATFVKKTRPQTSDHPDVWEQAETAPTVNAFDVGDTRTTVTVVGFSHTQGLDAQPSEDAWPTLRSGGGGHAVATTEPASVTFHTRDGEVQAEMSDPGVATTVRGGGGGSSRPHVVEPRAVVRRLTPTECERLMGWPDHHTRWRADGTELSDSTRYRMCGNGIAAPVAQWLAERLREVSR
jgi:site-specific DNA-cytosine methylase